MVAGFLKERASSDRPTAVDGWEKPAPLGDRVKALRLDDQPRRGGAGMLPWMLALFFSASTAFYAYRDAVRANAPDPKPVKKIVAPQTASASDPAKKNTPSPADAPVPASPVAAGKDSVALESKGFIVPAHQILVSPKVNGMVTALFVEEGRRVKKGDVLAEIESIEYAAEVDRAAAALEIARQRLVELENGSRPEEVQQARAELAETDAQCDQLKIDMERNRMLRQTRSVPLREFELAESQYVAMEKRRDKLNQQLQLLILGPRKERIDLARAEVQQAE
ncbi:MAG: biotin/lipoyl-binding protein, partial [Planctomycetia bacterium]